jgi:flagellar hook-associated protein 1 FlgK
MSSLFGSLSVALRSLLAQRGDPGTTTNGIANANPPGDSRQRSVLQEGPPVSDGLGGSGVSLDKLVRIRDRILELRMDQETQQQERLNGYLRAMRQVETLFDEAQGEGFQTVLRMFFDSLQAFAVDPTSLPKRQDVLNAAEHLAAAFRKTSSDLSMIQRGLDEHVLQTVRQINQQAAVVADLNRQIAALRIAGQDAGALLDQRRLAIRYLSSSMDVAVIDSMDGTSTVTTANGTPLVVGVHATPLETYPDAGGMNHIFSQGRDVTSGVNEGKLAGLVGARDDAIPAVLADLDNLAASLSSAVNAIHRTGFDLSGTTGRDFFAPAPTPGSNPRAAASIAVALTEPSQLAASSDGTPASNGTVLSLESLRDRPILSGQKLSAFYSSLVSRIGSSIWSTSAELDAEKLVLQQLENQRSAVSGVSFDEEVGALIQYQRAFEAAARVVAVVDELTTTAMNMLGTT